MLSRLSKSSRCDLLRRRTLSPMPFKDIHTQLVLAKYQSKYCIMPLQYYLSNYFTNLIITLVLFIWSTVPHLINLPITFILFIYAVEFRKLAFSEFHSQFDDTRSIQVNEFITQKIRRGRQFTMQSRFPSYFSRRDRRSKLPVEDQAREEPSP